jgi:microcystin-dependent protein
MSSKDFKVSTGLEVDSYEIELSSAEDRQTLMYDGTSYKPYDIVPVGSIEMWAGSSTPPDGWLLCNGQSYSWSQYTRLRSVIGISYGGSVDTSWNVPNLITSTLAATVIGTAAGGSLGNASKNFNSASISHSHNYNTTSIGSNTNGYGNHTHSSTGANDHSHGLSTNNWSHGHNSGGPSNSHAHNYFRGNSGGANTDFRNHGAHGVSNVSHSHEHSTTSDGAVNHSHLFESNLGNHNHNWNTSSVTSNSQGTDHTHNINKQSIYFIIKY